MRIGDAARRAGLESHVLRHWEELGLLAPSRLMSGHREYTEDDLNRVRMIRRLQVSGMSLASIRQLGSANLHRRGELVEAHRHWLREQIDRLRGAEEFLAHTLACRHPVIADCEACSSFVTRL